MIRFASVTTAVFLFTAAGFAGTDVSVPPFSKVVAHSGADVKLIYGAKERVTVIKGELKDGYIQVKSDGTLEIAGCKGFCMFHKTLEVEVVAPRIESVVAHSGADVTATGNFPKEPQLSVQAHSGGEVNVTAIPADTVDVQAHSGGDAHVKALSTLNAQAHSGGNVTYSGHPAHINSQSNSGGSVSGEN